jgi:hypothetical protein
MSKSPRYSLPAVGEPAPEQDGRATQPPPNLFVREKRYDYYEAHPEHKPRPLTARQIRRQRIREG